MGVFILIKVSEHLKILLVSGQMFEYLVFSMLARIQM